MEQDEIILTNQEEEIKRKQEFLRKEILDKGYDQSEFVQFCVSIKEKGDDLSNWTFEELESIVSQFQEKNRKNKPSLEDVNIDNMGNIDKIDSKVKKGKDIEIQCRKLDKTELNEKPITVVIKNPKEKDQGVFGQNYILYEMITNPFEWSVNRRYSDFDWLRKLLVKFYPGFIVPPLPNKKMGNRRFDLDFVMKRMKFLELFMNAVCENESFKASEVLLVFLSCADRSKFERKMKEFTAFQPSNYVEEYKTLDGIALLTHDEANEKYFNNIDRYFKLQTQILDKVNYNLRQFYNNMNSASDNLTDISKNFETLHILNSRVLMKQTITKTFEELDSFFKSWKKIIIRQNELIKNHVKDFFKYFNLEGQAYSQIVSIRSELKGAYINDLARINAKKEKLFSTGEVQKFEINAEDKTIDLVKLKTDKSYAMNNMCYKDNLALQLLHNQLGYMNKMNILELKKMIKKNVVKFIKNLETFDEKFYPTINDVSKFI